MIRLITTKLSSHWGHFPHGWSCKYWHLQLLRLRQRQQCRKVTVVHLPTGYTTIAKRSFLIGLSPRARPLIFFEGAPITFILPLKRIRYFSRIRVLRESLARRFDRSARRDVFSIDQPDDGKIPYRLTRDTLCISLHHSSLWENSDCHQRWTYVHLSECRIHRLSV